MSYWTSWPIDPACLGASAEPAALQMDSPIQFGVLHEFANGTLSPLFQREKKLNRTGPNTQDAAPFAYTLRAHLLTHQSAHIQVMDC